MAEWVTADSLLDATSQKIYLPPVPMLKQGELMQFPKLVMFLVLGSVMAGCSTTEWVHPNKPSDEYVNDYNKCQNAALRDPKLQQGSQLLILNATERCLQKEGWRLVEK
ncbi:hypothetical protein W02_00110 [Nitrospira sp. KM1]|nr:hypothetical protein W02_00110 [Nitrospira sp. KM1]